MRHTYHTRGIVLGRVNAGETNVLVTVFTRELGLVRARTQGLRRTGAKLASSLPTFAESELILVRGKEGWRLTGAILAENWFFRLESAEARERAGRVVQLFLRLVAGEAPDIALYPVLTGFFAALCRLSAKEQDIVEVLAALRILAALGLEAGTFLEGDDDLFSDSALARIATARSEYVARVNHGIVASGL